MHTYRFNTCKTREVDLHILDIMTIWNISVEYVFCPLIDTLRCYPEIQNYRMLSVPSFYSTIYMAVGVLTLRTLRSPNSLWSTLKLNSFGIDEIINWCSRLIAFSRISDHLHFIEKIMWGQRFALSSRKPFPSGSLQCDTKALTIWG